MAAMDELAEKVKAALRGEGEPGNPGETISVNEAEYLVDEVFAEVIAAAPTEAETREALIHLLGTQPFSASSFEDFFGRVADAILAAGFHRTLVPKTQDGEARTTEFEYGIRWEDGSDVAWPSRSAAEYELRGVYPNMIGQLIRRTVSRGSWVPVSPEGGE